MHSREAIGPDDVSRPLLPFDATMSHPIGTPQQLDSAANLRHTRQEWRLERLGWLAIALLLSAAILGVFGPGLFSRRQAASESGGLKATYEATERYEAPASLHLTIVPASGAETISLTVSRAFTDQVTLEEILPRPRAMTVTPEGLRLDFTAAGFPSTGVPILIRYKNDHFGPLRYELSLGPESVRINQFVLP